MRTTDTYENKATVSPDPDGREVADAKAAFVHARAVYDDAIAQREAVIAELWPTYFAMSSTHADFVQASGVIEKAEAELKSAQIAYNALAQERDRRVVAEQAAADRVRVGEKRELQRARARAAGVGSRLRRLIGGLL